MKFGKIVLLTTAILMSTLPGIAHAQDADATYTIGLFILLGTETFITEMNELGYVEGENVTYLYVSYEGVEPEQYQEHYNAQVKAMVDAGVDLFVTNTDTDAVNLQALTGDIPIVFARSDDPVPNCNEYKPWQKNWESKSWLGRLTIWQVGWNCWRTHPTILTGCF
ncbi:MAG: hypothetical protein JXB47_07190 [Anaerolineae bacterium]|nr:hypothetical protein [Anaerolineae bacterium]